MENNTRIVKFFTDCKDNKLNALNEFCIKKFGANNFLIEEIKSQPMYSVPSSIEALNIVLHKRIDAIEKNTRMSSEEVSFCYVATLQKTFLKIDSKTFLLSAGAMVGKLYQKKQMGMTTSFPLDNRISTYFLLPFDMRYEGIRNIYPETKQKPLIEVINKSSESESKWFEHALQASAVIM